MLPAWWLGLFPAAKNIISSYSGDLADSFNTDCQSIMGSEKYANVFPDLITGHTDPALKMTQSEFHTAKGGCVYSVGATGATTGRSAGNMGVKEPGDSKGFFLLDDPIKDRAQVKSVTQMRRIMEWWRDVVNTRVHKSSHIILMHTRWAQDDVAGRIIAEGALEDGWEILSFPELGPDLRYPNPYDHRTDKNEPLWPEEKGDYDELMKLKTRVGAYTWAALFQQNPAIDGGSILKVDDIRLYTRLPFRVEELKSSNIIAAWDLTFKSTGTSYVVGIILGKVGADFYLLDIVRGKMDVVQTKEAIKSMSDRWPNCRNWLIEKAANGEAILTLLKKEVSGLKGIRATVSKDERLHSIAPLFEAHNVHIPANHPLTKIIIEELSTFPNSANDDIVDCFSMALNHYGKLRGINHLRAAARGIGRR
jgi:predicted phage terminase large subunit-like protein